MPVLNTVIISVFLYRQDGGRLGWWSNSWRHGAGKALEIDKCLIGEPPKYRRNFAVSEVAPNYQMPDRALRDYARLIPSLAIRDSSVVGLRPKTWAAPPWPLMRHLAWFNTERMCKRTTSSRFWQVDCCGLVGAWFGCLCWSSWF